MHLRPQHFCSASLEKDLNQPMAAVSKNKKIKQKTRPEDELDCEGLAHEWDSCEDIRGRLRDGLSKTQILLRMCRVVRRMHHCWCPSLLGCLSRMGGHSLQSTPCGTKLTSSCVKTKGEKLLKLPKKLSILAGR